jgi:hypothetical protein
MPEDLVSSHILFTDESGINERYLGYGGVIVPASHYQSAERALADFARNNGFKRREFSWKKCSPKELDRYSQFAALFWDLNESGTPLDFRAMIVDTRRNPLRSTLGNCSTDEDGFYKFYHFFITRSLEIVARDATNVDLRVAVSPDQYPYRSEVLQATVGGRLRNELPDRTVVTEVFRETPKMHRLHQLADVLLGAITFRVNERDPQGLSHKAHLCGHIESLVGRRLDRDFMPGERPFNVWSFASRGSSRWADGSHGYVG